MAFKLRNIYEVFGYNSEYSNGDRLVVEKPLGKYTLGQINPNGVIEISSSSTYKRMPHSSLFSRCFVISFIKIAIFY